MASRPTTNHTIDYKCITIGVDGNGINGLVNNSSNKRCSNNKSEDGFVYTCSTLSNSTGYEYNYSLNTQSGDHLDNVTIMQGDTDRYTYSNYIRSNDKSEGTINLKDISDRQFSGKTTNKNDFVYNEGNSTTLMDGTTADKGKNPTTSKEYDVLKFYDTQTSVFSDQLTKVRNLTASEKKE